MTNSKKHTKRALLSSALSLLLCITMLIGTTWAWFTDSVTSAGNIIKSGTLDVEMSWADGKENPDSATWKDASTGAIFDYDLWEPGYVDVKHVKIANVGTLAFKYQIAIKANGELETNANGHTLADAIDVYYLENAAQVTDRTELVEGAKLGTLAQFLENNANPATNTATGKLYPKDNKDGNPDNHTVTIALKMREDAGNEYQNMSIGTDFSVQLLATQWTYEEDTFNDQYDALADETPDNEGWSYENVSTKVVENAANPFEITSGIATVSVPANALAAGDKFELAIDNFAENENGADVAISFELKLKRNGVLINTETDGVEYTVSLQLEKDLTINSVAHNGEAVTDYTYDADTGIMTLTVKHFSPFAISATKNARVVETENFEDIQAALEEYNESEDERPLEIVITDDVILNDENTIEVLNGKEVIIDLAGKDFNVETENEYALCVAEGATLTLTNSGDTGAYNFSAKNGADSGAIYVCSTSEDEKSVLNLENVKIVVDGTDGPTPYGYHLPVTVDGSKGGEAVININEGTVIDVIGSGKVAGVWAYSGSTVNMNGGVINVKASANQPSMDTVGVLVCSQSSKPAVFNMLGGTINVVGDGTFAMAVEVADGSSPQNVVRMSGGEINVSGKSASAFGVEKYADVKITGGKINMNVTEGSGETFVFAYGDAKYGVVEVASGVITYANENNFLTSVPARVNAAE